MVFLGLVEGAKSMISNFACDIMHYCCKELLGLSDRQIDVLLGQLSAARREWESLIRRSYLSDSAKLRYQDVLLQRYASLELDAAD